jgi:hypothetical protein
MLRGRHRGLPVAIDRAVVLPFEYRRDDSEREDQPSGPALRSVPTGMSGSRYMRSNTGDGEYRRRMSYRTSTRHSGDAL